MGLPKISQPLFPITVPSTGQETNFRPFTVKEEKILLVAQESQDADQLILAIRQIIQNCVQDVDVDTLAMFDIEYIMLKIRGQSVNNVIEFTIKDPETEENVEISFDINDIEVKKSEEHTNIINLSENHKLIMRYATINELKSLAGLSEEKASEGLFEVMVNCIDSLVEGEDTVYKLSDFSEAEVTEFIESLTSSTVTEIRKFFETTPALRIECPYTNSKGNDKTFVVEGLQSFFI
jgi:hypothetical protein